MPPIDIDRLLKIIFFIILPSLIFSLIIWRIISKINKDANNKRIASRAVRESNVMCEIIIKRVELLKKDILNLREKKLDPLDELVKYFTLIDKTFDDLNSENIDSRYIFNHNCKYLISCLYSALDNRPRKRNRTLHDEVISDDTIYTGSSVGDHERKSISYWKQLISENNDPNGYNMKMYAGAQEYALDFIRNETSAIFSALAGLKRDFRDMDN